MPENPEVALTRKLLENNYVDFEQSGRTPPNSRFSDWAIEMLSLGLDSRHLRLLCAAPEMDRDEVQTVFRHALNHHSLSWLLDEDRTYALQKRVIRDFLERKTSVRTTVARGCSVYYSDYGDVFWLLLEEDLSNVEQGHVRWEHTHFRGSDHLDARLTKCLVNEGLIAATDVMEINAELHQAMAKLAFE